MGDYRQNTMAEKYNYSSMRETVGSNTSSVYNSCYNMTTQIGYHCHTGFAQNPNYSYNIIGGSLWKTDNVGVIK